MMIAPKADPADGQIEYVRWGPVGRLQPADGLFPRFLAGRISSIRSPRARRPNALNSISPGR